MEHNYSFLNLKKLSAGAENNPNTEKIVIMGDCATQHLATAIKGMSVAVGMEMQVIDTDYNIIDALTLDEHSVLYDSKPDFVLIHKCTQKLFEKYTKSAKKINFADTVIAEIGEYYSRISAKSHAKILMFNFPEINDNIFGNYGFKQPDSFIFQLKKLNYLLYQFAAENKNIFLVDLNGIALSFGMDKFYDAKLYYTAKMPISLNAMPRVASNVLDVLLSLTGSFKKCVVLDLDNTLWGGVIGDDGIEGIQIGELGIGHAFESFQRWLKELKNRGIILAVCSKNNEDVAKEPFLKHPEMVLRLEDISVFVANWEDKVNNIKYIRDVLNIGMDSMVFIDDNPFERELVRSMLPEIAVPELPEDPARYLDYLKNSNLFETASYSNEDKDRTKQYKAEMERINNQKAFKSYDEYLENLQMIATVSPFDSFQAPRLAQLTQRSNQFNLRTVRCSEEDILSLINNNDYITLYFTLKDKFGDHGLIGLAVLKRLDKDTAFIENWLMSCRVLKRGMEAFIINSIISAVKNNGFKYVVGEYIKTSKNAIVENIYTEYGFTDTGDNRYKADVENFKEFTTFIKDEG